MMQNSILEVCNKCSNTLKGVVLYPYDLEEKSGVDCKYCPVCSKSEMSSWKFITDGQHPVI